MCENNVYIVKYIFIHTYKTHTYIHLISLFEVMMCVTSDLCRRAQVGWRAVGAGVRWDGAHTAVDGWRGSSGGRRGLWESGWRSLSSSALHLVKHTEDLTPSTPQTIHQLDLTHTRAGVNTLHGCNLVNLWHKLNALRSSKELQIEDECWVTSC